MNYTKNYHLPQWVKEDRIMMDDFNRMCADMEAGLTQNAASAAAADAKAAAASTKAATEAARVSGEAESRAFDRICRLAYNHYRAAQTVSPFPRQLGVFHLNTKLSGEGLTDMLPFQEWYLMSNAVNLDATGLFDLFQTQQNFLLNSSTKQPLIATFTAPFCGVIHELTLFLSSANENLGLDYNCNAKITDLAEGREVSSFRWILTAKKSNHTHAIELPIRQGHQYRLEVAPFEHKSEELRGRLVKTGLSFTRMFTGESASASHTFQNPAENLGLVAAASYKPSGDCAQPRLFIGSEEVPVWWTRTAENGRDREIVFRRNKPVRNGDTVRLQFSCGTGGTLELYDWGVMLL